MLDEQLVGLLEARSQRRGQQAAPELAGKLNLRLVGMGFVDCPQARQIEPEARTPRAEALLDLDRSRLDPRLGREDRLEPADQRRHARSRRFDVVLAHDVEHAVRLERREVPVGAVGQDADVALLELVAAGLDVAGELIEPGLLLPTDTEILLQLEDGQTALDVDPAARAVGGRHLAPDDAVVVEVEPAVAQQRRQVGLEIGFTAARRACRDPRDEIAERDRRADSGLERQEGDPTGAQRGARTGSPAS